MKSARLVATVTGFLTVTTVQCLFYDVYYKWKTIEYDLPPGVQLNSSEYIPQNIVINIIKIYENRMWIVTPRYFAGVPVTLNTIPYHHKYQWWEPFFMLHNESPKLQPFPSYEMNTIGDCNALQLAEGLEIDQFGRLWVVDVGRVNILQDSPLNLCPAKLLIWAIPALVMLQISSDFEKISANVTHLLEWPIFDVTKGRSKLIFTYIFPDNVAPYASNIVKEIQVACKTKDDCWAFISDVGSNRLVVYDHKNQESWTAQHPSMLPDPSKTNILVNGVSAAVPFGINGLGLSPKKYNFSELYFSPLSSTVLYKVKTDCLTDPERKQNGTLRMDDVIDLGEKPGQSDGFAMTDKGVLYYGNLPGNSIISTETYPKMTEIRQQRTVAKSDIDFLWPDGFAFDGKGTLVVTTSRFELAQKFNPTEYNLRVILLRRLGNLYAYNRV